MNGPEQFRRRASSLPVVETGLLREVQQVTTDAHSSELTFGAVLIYTGPSRIGKTTTAEDLERKVNAAYDDADPDSYRARLLYVSGDERTRRQRPVKRGIKILYWNIIGPIEDRTYWRYTEEALADEVVKALRRKRIQMVLVDEAGTLSADEIRGMISVWDMAQRVRWPLTIVLIGMDTLPDKVRRYEQVRNRISRWCFFEPYDIDAFWELLVALSPHFAQLDSRKSAHRAQVEFVHNACDGIIGQAIPFLARLAALRRGVSPDEVDLDFLRAVLIDVRRGEGLAREAQKDWSGPPKAGRPKTNGPATTPPDPPKRPPKDGRNRKSGEEDPDQPSGASDAEAG